MIEATEFQPFPNPLIRRCTIRRVVINGNTGNILESGSGQSYEIGPMIKETIFGRVVSSAVVQKVGDIEESYKRSTELRAIKVYSKNRLRALQGRTQENPLMEITAQQFVGDADPHVMGQIECCADEEHIFSIMRLCNGGELFDYIDDEGPMEEDRAKVMFRQLMSGLHRLQSLGVGHRDLSMENILYDASRNLYCIIDFGMCLRQKFVIDPATGATVLAPIHKLPICGKKNYVSPEVLREDPTFSPVLTDIWAAGIILFMVLTGVPPVDKATVADERYCMIIRGELGAMLASWDMDLSPEVVDLMQRMLQADPASRITLAEIARHPWMAP